MRPLGDLQVRFAGIELRHALRRALWYCAAAVGVALVTLLLKLLQPQIQPNRLQMGYLLLVLGLAIGGGSGPAIFASVLAFLTFDWYFITPVGHLVVSDAAEWFALGLFLVVGVSTGSLAARLKQSAAEARRRGDETRTLYELSSAILAGTNLDRVLGIVVDCLLAALKLESAAVLLASDTGEVGVAALAATDAVYAPVVREDGGPRAVFAALSAGTNAVNPPRAQFPGSVAGGRLHARYVPLVLNARPIGVLAAYATGEAPLLGPDAARLLDAFAAQTSLAIGRLRLIEEEERARAAAESDRLKSSFLASISHDLRTPLTAIETAAALLHAERKREARDEAKAQIDGEVNRLNRLVGDLLEMSRIEGGNARPQLLSEDLAELVGATAARMSRLLDGRRLELEAADGLPPVPLDAAQMVRVLTNLIDNAIKFSPPGSAIAIGLTAAGDRVRVRIHNRGEPIPEEEQRRIFDKFYRLQRGGHAEGTGLGLAICKGIVEAHGGTIWTRNEDGGVAFYVALQAAPPEDAAAAAWQAVPA